MTSHSMLAAVAALAGIAAPASAQTAYPYPSQPSYGQPVYGQPVYGQPVYGQPSYGQPGYGQPGYAQNPIAQVIDSLLGNRYQANDRQAVSQCASVALNQAQYQYRGQGYGQQRYGQQGYGYQQNIAAPAMRVTAITDVQRRSGGVRVKGLISSGYGGGYNGQSAYYQNRAMGAGDLSFRCNVDYRGVVSNVRIDRTNYGTYRRY